VGDIAGIARIGFKGLCLEDSPLGVRFADLVSVFPSGLSTAATFSKALAYARGRAMGEEHRLKGVNVQLGPGMNMHRAPAAGRNWEMNGADPYLSGEAAYYTTKGIQDAGVQACAKHWLGNEQEINRNSYRCVQRCCRVAAAETCLAARTSTTARRARSTSIPSCAPCRRMSRR
jgi:beta-glucosidase